MSAFSFHQVFYSYENNPPALEEVNLKVEKGSFIGVIGPNGGGKTTFLRLIAQLLSPSSGDFFLPPSLKVGYVPQNLRLDKDFPITTFDFILTGATFLSKWFGRYPLFIKKRAKELLRILQLGDYENHLLGSLSGGVFQKALLARALLADPDILLLDEPTANVDFSAKKEIFQLLESLKGKKTILVITHDWKTAIDYLETFLCINKKVTSLSKESLCKHFTLGLYHPLGDKGK